MARRPEYIEFNKNNVDHELKTIFIQDLYNTDAQDRNKIHSRLLTLGKFSIEDPRLDSRQSEELVVTLDKLHLINFYSQWRKDYKKGNAKMENIKSFAQLQLNIISAHAKLIEKSLSEEGKMEEITSIFHSAIDHTFSSYDFIFNKNPDQINKKSLLFQNKLNYILENWKSIHDQLYEHNLISSDYHLLSTSFLPSNIQYVNNFDDLILLNPYKEINDIKNIKEPLKIFKQLQQVSKLGFQKTCFDFINPNPPDY